MAPVRFKLFVENEETLATKRLLESFFEKYDLSPYLFTKTVKIKPNVIPHSHPMLTLNTFWNKSPNHLLSTFLHEQIHWYINWHQRAYSQVHRSLIKWYPDIPHDKRLTASNGFSTYLHLVICWLEFQGLKKYIGYSQAQETFHTFPHYKWIFGQVVFGEMWVLHGSQCRNWLRVLH